MRLLVVGAGEMGRWLARTLRPAVDRVAFADANPQAAMDAADELVDGRVVPLDTDEPFDCVALAVPIPAVADAVAAHAANAATGALVDVSGAMTGPLTAMAEHAGAEYASFHPLFAPPRAPGRIAYVPGEVGSVVETVRDALAEAGNEVFETTAAEHDRAMETVQTAAHTAVLAYALAAEDVPQEFHTPVSGPLADLAATVTEGDVRVYEDIRETFGGADAVAAAARELADADRDAFADLFESAREGVGSEPRDGNAGQERDGDEDGNGAEEGNGDEDDVAEPRSGR